MKFKFETCCLETRNIKIKVDLLPHEVSEEDIVCANATWTEHDLLRGRSRKVLCTVEKVELLNGKYAFPVYSSNFTSDDEGEIELIGWQVMSIDPFACCYINEEVV